MLIGFGCTFKEAGGAAAWVTEKLWLVTPAPESVTVAVRAPPVFAPADTETSPPLREADSQAWLLDAPQFAFELTVRWKLPPLAARLAGDVSTCKWKEIPAWFTLIFLDIPPPETVIVPFLDAPVLPRTLSIKDPLPEPLVGEALSQVPPAVRCAVQDTFDSTNTDAVKPFTGAGIWLWSTCKKDCADAAMFIFEAETGWMSFSIMSLSILLSIMSSSLSFRHCFALLVIARNVVTKQSREVVVA